ncbi:hypothetical protein LI7559_02975 [Bacillus licheniformis LMG 7559]|nr:hypothetical protein LI7559_02975 [Bacillus licheniformis LMG 7559]
MKNVFDGAGIVKGSKKLIRTLTKEELEGIAGP